MYKFVFMCFVAANLVQWNDATLTDVQKSKIYGKLVTLSLECIKDFPLTLDHIKSLRSKVVPDDEVAKCFTQCLYKQLGLMDETGKLSEKAAQAAARNVFGDGDDNMAKVDDLIGKCIYVNDAETSDGDKGCDRAKLASECFIKNAPELDLEVNF